MTIKYDITRRFDKELKKFSKKDRARVAESIERYVSSSNLEQDDKARHIYQPHKIALPDGLDSSLYILRASNKIRVILTIDDDPIFGQTIVTLMRVVKHDEVNRAFNSISESLYQHLNAGGQ